MAFQQGLSGLNSASAALNVTSNNVANSSTVGFKSSSAHFSDIYAASLQGSGASDVGIGTNVSAVSQQFTQGNISTTSNSLDIAINGSGFYILNSDGTTVYSRNGQFTQDKAGYIVNDAGDQLTGYLATNGVVTSSGDPQPIKISTENVSPNTTSKVDFVANLDSASTAKTATFNSTDSTTYNWSRSTTVYDSLGSSHNLSSYFTKTADNAWTVNYSLDGTVLSDTTSLTFDSKGALTAGSTTSLTIPSATLATGASDLTLSFNLTGTTQYGTDTALSSVTQDGYTSGALTGLSIGSDGVVQGTYSNGQTKTLAQIALATFANANGLQSIGNNEWTATYTSGAAVIGTPNTGTFGTLQSEAVEDSNVDLTAELVNMIVEQRNYQANAKSITTQNEILNTLINM
jgi:flagellar hook protein FlgE